ncbi:MAG: tetratricopeptide repeat protein [Candidatus Omnitrophica bacterium]|nr:tetratricopeptide repeat protein [Candidatus Omnitrophota bacterium]
MVVCSIRRSLLLWVIATATAASVATADDEATNWPSMISRLRQQMQTGIGRAQARQQLAIAYNNYGVSLSNQGEWDLAIQQLQESLLIDPTGIQARKNLVATYLHKAQEAYTRHQINDTLGLLEKVVALDPNVAQAFLLRGEVEYGRQRLKEAKAAWEQASTLDPTLAPSLQKRLAQVTQELPIESKFERLSQAYFDVRYEEELQRPVGFDIRDALLEARRDVGSDFAYWPKQKLVVLVYSDEKFRAIRQETPEWVGGLFDGKIRVPLPGRQLTSARVKQIVFHEYTHAVIQDLTNGACPLWLNEGLAEYEGAKQDDRPLPLLRAASQAKHLIPWLELSDHFSYQLSTQEVGLAYEQSYSLANYLVTRYGFWRIRNLLKRFAEGQSWDAACAEEFRLKLTRLESNWRETLPEALKGAP